MDTPRVNITICGDGGAGKSSITLRLVRGQWTHEYDPTIEDSYSLTRTIDGNPYILSLTDTAGQEEYRALQSQAARRADAFLLVYDITNRSSLYEQLPYFFEMVSMEAEGREDRGEPQPVVIIAGNKCDLRNERMISSEEGWKWAKEHGCGFMETSARECVNVEETFALLVRRVVDVRKKHDNPEPAKPEISKQKSHHAHGDSFAQTKPLSPIDHEKAAKSKDKVSFGAWMRRIFCCSFLIR